MANGSFYLIFRVKDLGRLYTAGRDLRPSAAIKLETVQAIVFKITFIEKRLETVERDMVI